MATATTAALRALLRLRQELDRGEYEVLAAMRADGVPWREIAEVYGVTVQAARQRFDRLEARFTAE